MSFKRIRGGILGIALSLVPLVVVFQVANGMIGGISARFIETSTYHIQVTPWDQAERNISPAVVERLQAIKGVTWVGPELQGLALASSRHASIGVTLRAVLPQLAQEPGFKANLRIIAGSFDIADPQAVVIGQEIATSLHLEVGDPMRIVTARGLGTGSMVPRISTFRVAAIVTSGYQQLDGMWVFINLDRGRRILPGNSGQEFLGLKVDHPYRLPNPLFSYSQTDDRLLNNVRDSVGPQWRTLTWFEQQRGQFQNFMITRTWLVIIMALIVLIASVNVFSAMIMLVMEKQQEIAILKSVGAKPGAIASIFIIAGGVTGAIGATLGLGIGAIAASRVNEIMMGLEWLINFLGALIWRIGQGFGGAPFQSISIFNPAFYLDRIPIEIRFEDLLWMALLTIGLSMAVSYFPARRAGRLRPVQIFRRA